MGLAVLAVHTESDLLGSRLVTSGAPTEQLVHELGKSKFSALHQFGVDDFLAHTAECSCFFIFFAGVAHVLHLKGDFPSCRCTRTRAHRTVRVAQW